MKITCDNCRVAYVPARPDPSLAVCPYCEHVNRPHAEWVTDAPAELDPLQTMQFPAEGVFGGRPEGEPRAAREPAAGARLELAVIVEGRPPKRHVITQPRVTIGRGQCDIRLADPEVSREHCAIEILADRVVLRDSRSANGTLVNGQLIAEHVLCNGDEIRIGSTLLRFEAAPCGALP